MKRIPSYPSIYAIGHKAIQGIFDTDVLIEEKVDGSQFSFARIDGDLVCRSKGQALITSNPEKMFAKAVESVDKLDLREGFVYRGEYLQSPKHNTLAYSRNPHNHVILFDVMDGLESYLSPIAKRNEAVRIGLECVPTFFEGRVESMEQFNSLLERESCLGGCKVEGVVVKNYALFLADKKIALGKYVSEAFKEKHGVEWKKSNPTRVDLVAILISQLKTDARWDKAIQHLRDSGSLEWTPRDIGKLMKEVPEDILKDSEGEIKDQLFAHFWPQIRRGVTNGLPEFYKQRLAESAFSASTLHATNQG